MNPYLVQSRFDLVLALVALVHAPVDQVQVNVDLFQAHSSQGGLLSVVSRKVVVGPSLGLIGFVWSMFVRGRGRNRWCVG